VVTVGEQLKNQKLLADIGGSPTSPTSQHPPDGGQRRALRADRPDKAVLRQLIQVSTRIVQAAYAQQEEVASLLDERSIRSLPSRSRRRRRGLSPCRISSTTSSRPSRSSISARPT